MCPFHIPRRKYHDGFRLIALTKAYWPPQGKSSFPLTELKRPRKSPSSTAGARGWQPSLESFSTHLPLSLTSPGLCYFRHMPRAPYKTVRSQLRLVRSGAQTRVPACSLSPPWKAGRTLPVRQLRPKELAEAARPWVALKGLSWDQALLLTLSEAFKFIPANLVCPSSAP